MPEQKEIQQKAGAAPKKKVLGCALPLFIGILVLCVALLVVSLFSGAVVPVLISKVSALFGFHVNIQMPAWLSVAKPKPELPSEEIFHIFSFTVTNTLITTWLTMVVLVGFSAAATRRMKIIPRKVQNLIEFIIDAALDFCEGIAGKVNTRVFFPIVVTIFLFVICNAWLSLLPGFGSILITNSSGESVPLLRGANTDINTPLALAIVSFVVVEYFGFKALKLKYLKKFLDVGELFKGIGLLVRGKVKTGFSSIIFGIINVFIGLIETMTEFARIISFTFRLFGNMTAGEIVLLVITFLAPFLIADFFYGLELLVGFVQALVFSGLTLIFLTLAVTSHEHNESGEGAK